MTTPSLQNRRTFRNAVSWAYAMTFSLRGVSALITFVLASLLDRADFGVVAMAFAFIILVERLASQGLAPALIQRQALTPRHCNAAFWMIMVGAVLLAGVTIMLAPWWSRVNDAPTLAPVMTALALVIPLRALSVVPHALLRRRLDYRGLAILTTASSLLGGALGIVLALRGWGAWALVAQSFTTAIGTTTLYWVQSRWCPSFAVTGGHARELFRFGRDMLAGQLGTWLANQADTILLGLMLGPIAVGLYRIADRVVTTLLEMTTRSIQTVALPHYSNVQNDRARLGNAAYASVRWSALITLPILATLIVCAPTLLRVIGPQWVDGTAVVRILAVLAAVKSVTLFTGPLLVARGRPGVIALQVWALAIVTTIAIAITLVVARDAALPAQIAAVAAARTGSFILVSVPLTLWLAHHVGHLNVRHALLASRPGVLIAALCLAIGFGVTPWLPASPPAVLLVAQLGTIGVLSALAACGLSSDIRTLARRAVLRVWPFPSLTPTASGH